jgi:uncharacterized protein with von Willebrand factor type A (vWA) domain
MKSFIYRRWDGTQDPFSLKRKEIVDQFMENIMKGMSPDMAVIQMMWEGFPMAGMDFKVMSLKEMVQELQQQMFDLFANYSLDKAFDDPVNEIRNLLEEEAMSRAENGMEDLPAYEELPRGLYSKLQALQAVDFANSESEEVYNHWKDRQQDIIDLYEFYGEYGDRFVGKEYLDFEQAVEIMRQFQAIQKLEQQILSGQIGKIDLEELKRILGENAGKSFNVLLQIPDVLSGEGVARFGQKQFEMTPRGMRSLGEKAFGNVYQQVKKDRQGGHRGNAPETGEIEPDTSRPYEFGDRFDLDISKTILNAVAKPGQTKGRVTLSPDEFYVREREQLITSTTVVLLDLSWSMSFGGRFEAAKKVALALDHYIRTRFPKDKVHIVGFSTEARELRGNELALAAWDPANPYTNLQGGLRMAMKLIKRSGNRNNRVLVITDGQPTAYYDKENHLHVEMPMDMFGLSHNAAKATLGEVRKVTAAGMNIEIFMLDDSPVLVEFSRQICRINKGRAVVSMPDKLGRMVVVEEIKRRGGRI